MIEPFGTTRSGAAVSAVALRAGRLRARILTIGAILQDLRLDGRPLTLGGADIAAYDDGPMRHFGAVIGPVAGRLRDARGRLGDETLALDVGDVPHALHGGAHGLHGRVWQVAERTGTRVALTTSADPGAGGFPGARRFRAEYALAPDALHLVLAAETDAPTWVNLTHHGYWHLGGPAGVDGHRLQIHAGHVLPVDAETLPTGEIRPVADTPFDFRAPRGIGATSLDNCFCLADAEQAMTAAADLAGPDGTRLRLETTAPGLQVFSGDGAATPGHSGHHGAPYAPRPGLALEPQGWPDAPNHPDFPSIRLEPGETWRRGIVWRIAPPG